MSTTPTTQTTNCLPEWTDEREARLRQIATETTGEFILEPRIGGPAFTLWMRELFAEIDRQRHDITQLIEGASEHEANG